MCKHGKHQVKQLPSKKNPNQSQENIAHNRKSAHFKINTSFFQSLQPNKSLNIRLRLKTVL